MLLSADPLLHRPPVKVLSTTYTGSPWCCDSARTAAPPRSGPVRSQRLSRKTESTIFSRPPRTKIAPPPPPSYVSPVLLPSANVRCWTTSRGAAWSSQCGRPGLLRVAGVLVEDAALAAAAEGDQPAAVEDDPLARVDDLRGRRHHDGHRVGAAAERDDAAPSHGADDGPRRAALRACRSRPSGRVGGVDGPRLLRHRHGARRRRRRLRGDRRQDERGGHGAAPHEARKRNMDRPYGRSMFRKPGNPLEPGSLLWCLLDVRPPSPDLRVGATSAAPPARAGARARPRCRAWRRCRPACAGGRR